MSRDPVPPRRRVDLTRLPVWLQYAIAIAVVAIVVAAVWALGTRQAPGPGPIAVGAAAFVIALLLWSVFGRRR
jgi:chromate transport protein ChrA